ncbi:aminoglycoside phosphotransferase family protein [Roseovarius aquimarinus]|uniref:Aminoglycoside phosphotransferase family protein n=1 Tax=Roseovarius aquimarinus TaxID=1229156 RepID=A0ABW7I3N8_9RHOB
MNADAPLDPQLRSLVARQLEDAARAEPRLARIVPGALIRHVKRKRIILRAALDGRAVILRMHLDPADGAARRDWDEMERLWPYMSQGDLRIPEPICAAPEAGVTVQEDVPGTPLMSLLYSLDEAERGAHLPRAAAWLRASTAPTEAFEAAQPDRWIARAERAARQQPFDGLQKIEAGILAQMRRLAPAIEAAPWRCAICHGDFHPNNLIVEAPRVTGIDLGGSRRMPVLKDIARFAMHMGRRRLRLSPVSVFGVDRDCLAEFAQGFALDAHERGVVLPFFLGFEALIRVENLGLPPGRIARAAKTYAALLADLERAEAEAPLI